MSNLSQFKAFLIEAKKNTFHGTNKKVQSSRPNSDDFTFKKYDYYYLDSHIGKQKFIGQEVIWKEEKSYWGMNYSGKLLTNEVPSGFTDFLTEALSKVSEDAPYRGPKSYRKADFEYQCLWSGEVDSFKGEEHIFYKGNPVFKLDFHGGTLS